MNNKFTCLDSEEMSLICREYLDIPRKKAVALGLTAFKAGNNGYYVNSATGEQIDWNQLVSDACAAKRSIAPGDDLPSEKHASFPETQIQVTNETTLSAALRLTESGLPPLVLNFANGVQPGGGFVVGSLAQEEVLCRSSALYKTLANDPMYESHKQRQQADSTDWAIYSPNVPVFRMDDGIELDSPWLLNFITCAAPYAPTIGKQEAGDLLQKRIQRILSIAKAYGHPVLVLGAWGCGAFGNDPHRTANDFKQALQNDFSHVVFAIADWSTERKFLNPFRDAFDGEQDNPHKSIKRQCG